MKGKDIPGSENYKLKDLGWIEQFGELVEGRGSGNTSQEARV